MRDKMMCLFRWLRIKLGKKHLPVVTMKIVTYYDDWIVPGLKAMLAMHRLGFRYEGRKMGGIDWDMTVPMRMIEYTFIVRGEKHDIERASDVINYWLHYQPNSMLWGEWKP